MPALIDTDSFSRRMRERSINVAERKLLVSNVGASDQAVDLTEPSNCQGFGRIRHFRRQTSNGWPENPLPIEPASNALGITGHDALRAQVFQNASCNWRCWYCYVPFALLNADESRSAWMSADDLIDSYLREQDRPAVIDLSGGQPDLVPEWIPWMMQTLRDRGLERETYLWSDDNLSNDYFWKYLDDNTISLILSYRNYAKVCCFKGFDDQSFEFNTGAEPSLFRRQLDIVRRYVASGVDVYGYVTLTTPSSDRIAEKMTAFVDTLQEIHSELPLRIIPLEVQVFSTVTNRMDDARYAALQHQKIAVECWQDELTQRFSATSRGLSIVDVNLRYPK